MFTAVSGLGTASTLPSFRGNTFFKIPHIFLQLKGYKQHFCVATFDIFFSAQIKGKLR